jgi:hypothetical protein
MDGQPGCGWVTQIGGAGMIVTDGHLNLSGVVGHKVHRRRTGTMGGC